MNKGAPPAWDHEVDFICVGSGAAGLAAALRAQDLGLDVLMVEASDRIGGSTAISGGVVWIPDNPDMAAKGIPDSPEEALAYLQAKTQGQVSEERLRAYVTHSRRMLDWMHQHTRLRLQALAEYSDYYQEAPGGKPGGRSMESDHFDGRELGEHFVLLRRPHPQSQILGRFGIYAREAHGFLVPSMGARLRLVWRMVQYALRWWKRRGQPRDTRLHAGNALVARLLRSMLDRGVTLWLDSPVLGLVVDQGRVVGARIQRQDAELRVRVRHGVMLGAGGFERNGPMRAKYQRQPTSPDWNAGNQRNLGDGIRMGVEAGGQLDLMDEAWWAPVTLLPRSPFSWVLVIEKSLPGSLMVNRHARRFCNEAAPYLDIGKAMYAGDAVPDCFLIFDAEFRHRYPVGPIAPGYAQPDSRLSRRLREGFLLKADSIPDLAQRCGLDPAALQQTIDRFNTMCDAGVDQDFHRGEAGYDRYYSDHTVKPNPTMRALRKGPFYAIRVYPGDLGTKGGLVTDTGARVLDADGQPIPGLFAAGNTTASVMGPTYPGAGGTIGPALTFGFLAAEAAHADAACPHGALAQEPT